MININCDIEKVDIPLQILAKILKIQEKVFAFH